MTKTNKSFLYDLARGGHAEDLIVKLFTEAGFPSSLDKNARANWDMESRYGETYFTTEVKYDEYEHKSGNIAIETYNPRSDKPSGVTATKAFFWAHVLVNQVVWVTTVDFLKDYLDNHEPSRIIERGGDGNATLYLYSGAQILPDVFTRVDTMTKDELQSFITMKIEERLESLFAKIVEEKNE